MSTTIKNGHHKLKPMWVMPYCTGQCTDIGTPLVSYRPHVGEIQLFRLVNGYRAETYSFLNLQNRKFHFWERERGRVNERPNL